MPDSSSPSSNVLGPLTAHVYHPLETTRFVVAMHEDDLAAIGMMDHDWVRVWRPDQSEADAVLARVENADYRLGMTAKPVERGHPRLSRALRSKIEISRRRFSERNEQVMIAAAPESAGTQVVLGIVQPEARGGPTYIWLDPALAVPDGTWVEVERPDVDGHGRRIRGFTRHYAATITQIEGTERRYVALSRSQQALLGLDASALQPGAGAQLPELVLRRFPDIPGEPIRPVREVVLAAARLAVGESQLAAEARLGDDLDGLAGLARLSQNLYEALGLTDGDWVRVVSDGRRSTLRRAILAWDESRVTHVPAAGAPPDHHPDIGLIWLDGDALGELDLRHSGDSATVGRDPVQAVRAAVGHHVLSAVLAFATVIVIEQSILGLIAAMLVAVLVLYVAFAQQRSRVRRGT